MMVYSKNLVHEYSDIITFASQYSDIIEQIPTDFIINSFEEALNNLGIDKNHPAEIKTPIEKVQIRARNIEHLFSRNDLNRYKSINKMFVTLKNPLIINEYDDKKYYFKLFKDGDKINKHLTVTSKDKNGSFLITTMPVKRDNWYLKQLKRGTIVYDSSCIRRKDENHPRHL